MTPDNESHLQWLSKQLATLLESKYRAGNKEHSGNLLNLPIGQLLEEAIYENIDQLTYLLTAKKKLNDLIQKYDPNRGSNLGAGGSAGPSSEQLHDSALRPIPSVSANEILSEGSN